MKIPNFPLFLFGGAAIGMILGLAFGVVMTVTRPVYSTGALPLGGMGAIVFLYYLIIAIVSTVIGALLGVGAYFLVPRLGWSVYLRGVFLTALALFVVQWIFRIV